MMGWRGGGGITVPCSTKSNRCRMTPVSKSIENAPGHEQGAIGIADPLSRRSLCRSWHLTRATTVGVARIAGCRASQGRFPPPLRIRQCSSIVGHMLRKRESLVKDFTKRFWAAGIHLGGETRRAGHVKPLNHHVSDRADTTGQSEWRRRSCMPGAKRAWRRLTGIGSSGTCVWEGASRRDRKTSSHSVPPHRPKRIPRIPQSLAVPKRYGMGEIAYSRDRDRGDQQGLAPTQTVIPNAVRDPPPQAVHVGSPADTGCAGGCLASST